MHAVVLEAPGVLRQADLPVPEPGPHQVLVEVAACGVCRTDLHFLDGELVCGRTPRILGHEIVGRVVCCGEAVHDFRPGDRVGVPWLGSTCGACSFCLHGQENLCGDAQFTGADLDGGYAEFTVADHRYCLALPDRLGDVESAPLLCAGLIGYRAYRLAGDAAAIGIYGFGAAAHIVTQLAVQQGRRIHAFTRPGDEAAQAFARRLGASWAGDSGDLPPEQLDAAILFAPVGAVVPLALRAVRRGGTVLCGGIHMSDIPSFPYADLWGERVLRSVANLTRADGIEFFAAIADAPITIETRVYPLGEARRALEDLRVGAFAGAAVLIPPRGPHTRQSMDVAGEG